MDNERLQKELQGKRSPHPRRVIPAVGVIFLMGFSVYSSELSSQPSLPEVSPSTDLVIESVNEQSPAYLANAIAATDKFVKLLDDKLKGKALFDFNSEKRPGWSNLPPNMVPRNGVALGELSKEQQTAAMEVVASVVSKEGYKKILDIIAADDFLAGKEGDKGGKGGKEGKGPKGGNMQFGTKNFYLAIFGKPSADQPWLVQFGGHHLALNVTIVGKDFVLTPTLTCAQPTSFPKDGKTVRPLATENDTAFKLINSLDEKQKEKAIFKDRVSDLILGPGKDGRDLKAAGIKGSDLTDKQQELLLELAGAWVNILQEDSAKARMADIKAQIKDTYFGWSGPTAEGSAAYFRVQGPSVVIEYAPQGGVSHVHTIVRELGNDYGKKLIK